jgi:hypothetical protein
VAAQHADTRQRILQYLASPPSHRDPLRSMPVDQLEPLSDPALVHQTLELLMTDNKDGSVLLSDGTSVSLR